MELHWSCHKGHGANMFPGLRDNTTGYNIKHGYIYASPQFITSTLPYKQNNVVGCYLDLEMKQCRFTLNGKFSGPVSDDYIDLRDEKLLLV